MRLATNTQGRRHRGGRRGRVPSTPLQASSLSPPRLRNGAFYYSIGAFNYSIGAFYYSIGAFYYSIGAFYYSNGAFKKISSPPNAKTWRRPC